MRVCVVVPCCVCFVCLLIDSGSSQRFPKARSCFPSDIVVMAVTCTCLCPHAAQEQTHVHQRAIAISKKIPPMIRAGVRGVVQEKIHKSVRCCSQLCVSRMSINGFRLTTMGSEGAVVFPVRYCDDGCHWSNNKYAIRETLSQKAFCGLKKKLVKSPVIAVATLVRTLLFPRAAGEQQRSCPN